MKSRELKRTKPGLKSAFSASQTPNMVGEGIRIQGTYLSPEDAFIEGTIEGGVNVEGKLVLGQTGKITGNVKANEIVICGTVEGDLQCKNKTTLKVTARVKGNIFTSALIVEEDAVVEGEIYMSETKSLSQPGQEQKAPKHEMALIS